MSPWPRPPSSPASAQLSTRHLPGSPHFCRVHRQRSTASSLSFTSSNPISDGSCDGPTLSTLLEPHRGGSFLSMCWSLCISANSSIRLCCLATLQSLLQPLLEPAPAPHRPCAAHAPVYLLSYCFAVSFQPWDSTVHTFRLCPHTAEVPLL